jgi:poly(A) polymerase
LLAALSVENARELDDRLHALEQTDIAPQPLITGDDLTAAGLAPGPVFKRVLDAVYDAQLEDRIASKDQAMELAMRLARC